MSFSLPGPSDWQSKELHQRNAADKAGASLILAPRKLPGSGQYRIDGINGKRGSLYMPTLIKVFCCISRRPLL